MEEFLYNILWIDDEHESLTGTKGRAKRNGINLVPYKSLNGGMSELGRNYPYYDGVLLDAKIFENEEDEKGTEDTFNVHRAKEYLLQLKKKFEIFVLTGQAEAYEDKTFKKAFINVYKKGSDTEIDRLFTDIKEAARNQGDTQLRQTYKRAFDVCSERYIGEYAGQDLLALLKVSDETNIGSHFNTIRKIVEDLFTAFHKFNLLPSEFITPSVALNQSSIFLAGQDQHENTDPIFKQYRNLEETHLPQQIAYFLRSILYTTQDGSHRSLTDKHVKDLKTPYLFKSVLFQLMDVLAWFKIYVDSKPKTQNWERVKTINSILVDENRELQSGQVINLDALKGFAFFKPDVKSDNIFIPPHLVSNHGLQNFMRVNAEIEEYTNNRTGGTMKRIKYIEIQ
jgi:truncated hemoglobin YjbI